MDKDNSCNFTKVAFVIIITLFLMTNNGDFVRRKEQYEYIINSNLNRHINDELDL